MEDLESAVMDWARDGFCCSQIMILAGLSFTGKDNPDLVAASNGLCKGGYDLLGTCGALTGSYALLGFYAGKGTRWEIRDPKLLLMAEELGHWFREEMAARKEGISCREMLGGKEDSNPLTCYSLILMTLEKTLEILTGNGFDLSENRQSP